jgi:cytochrome oxidase assembly protein ShyY1
VTPRPRASGVLFVVVTLAALVGVAITASLGRWQLGRAAEKLAYEQTLTSRAALPALDGASLAKADAAGAAEDLRHRTVELEGLWLPAHTIYLDNRQMQGRPGFFVITPLQLRGTSAVVLVQRGWVPRNFQDRTQVPDVVTPAGTVQVKGRVAAPPSRLYEFSAGDSAQGSSRIRASYFTYYVIRPEGRKNYGELIEPQRPMPAMAATTLEGGAGALVDLKGQWLLVSVADSQCDTDCQKHLYLQRQLRESVGREKDRVDWVWLVTDDKAPPAALEPALKQAQVRRVDEAALAQWLAPAAGQALRDHIYVVDPMGHWMMRFPARMDAAGAAKAKKDLERLLRASASWDEAGRPRKP